MTCHKMKALLTAIAISFSACIGTAQAADEVLNLLPNPGFEEWKDGQPVGWTVTTGKAVPENLHRFGGKRSLNLHSDRMDQNPHKLPMRDWPYCQIQSDEFALEPNSQYILRAWLNLQGASVGDYRFYVQGTDGVEIGRYSTGWSKSHPWLQITTTLRTRSATAYKMILGGTSGQGRPTLVDDITIEKVGGLSDGASEVDKARGFSLFSRSVMKSLDINTILPSPAEMVDTLRIRMARDEYEPALLGMHALQSMTGVDVRVAGHLTGPDNARIDKKDVVIRRLQNEMLPLTRPRNVGINEMLAWWATVKTEKTTAAGTYRGNLEIIVEKQVLHTLPLEVEVLDVTLPAPDIAFWAYHHEHYFQEEYLTEELRKAYYADMYAHGMNTVSLYNNADVDGSANLDWEHNTAEKDKPFHYKYGLETIVPMILESGLCSAGQPLFFLPSRGDVGDQPGYGWGGVPKEALKEILDGWRERGWPELVLYCGDEPGSNTGLVPRLKMVKEWVPSIKLTTAGLEPDALAEYYDVWILGEASVDRKAESKAQELGSELWAYNCTAPNTNMPFSRAFYGFWAYKTGVKGVAEWAYYDLTNWTADDLGNTYGSPGSRHSRVAVSRKGPVPTISWEATREGIDDYRHAQMLRDLCKTAEAQHQKIAALAESLLSEKDREAIIDREDEQFRQHNPKKTYVWWKATTPQQALAEKVFLASRKAEKELEKAMGGLKLMIEPIPFDGMITRSGINYHMQKWSRWTPPMGPEGTGEDPMLITENKRKVILSYIIALQTTIKATDNVLHEAGQ